MNALVRCFAMLILGATCVLAQAQHGERVALVVGNSAYSQSPLANPHNDAQAMAALLRRAGFVVDQELDTTQAQLTRAVARFGQAIREPQVKFGLFYYAGHGLQLEWRNYLVPVSADIRSAEDVKKQTVDVSALLAYMGQAKGRSFLVILDACRDDPFAGSYRPSAKGLSQFDAPVGSLLAYATAPGSVALDGEGENGLYTGNLLREFSVPGVRVEDAFKRVRLNVRMASHGQQIPWESTSLEEDVYLFPSARRKLSDDEQDRQLEQEIASWLKVKSTRDPEQLADFIRQYPSGSASELAQFRLSRLLAERARQETVQVAVATLPGAPMVRDSNAAQVEMARQKAQEIETQRLAAEREAQARQEAAAAAQAQRDAERAEALRRENEQAQAVRLENQRLQEAQARAAQLERERQAALEQALRQEQARLEAERLAAAREQALREARAREEALQQAQAQAAAEAAAAREAQRQREEQARAEAERAEQARLEMERLRAQAQEAQAREAAAREARARQEAALAQAQRDAERAAAERRAQEQAQAVRLENQRLQEAQARAAQLERERQAALEQALRQEQARLEAERLAAAREQALREARAREEALQQAQAQAAAEAAAAREAQRQREEQARAEAERAEQARAALERIRAQEQVAQAELAAQQAKAAKAVPEPAADAGLVLAPTPYSKGFQEYRRNYQKGDVYDYRVIDLFTRISHPLNLQVTAVDMDGDRVEYNNGEYLSDTMGNIVVNPRGGLSTPRQFYPAELFVGKRWQTAFKQSRANGVVYTFRYEMKVVGRETITVPAGTFDTFKIEARGYNMQLNARLERNIWVAPGVSGDIAHETLVRLRNGSVEQNDRQELVSYRAAGSRTAQR